MYPFLFSFIFRQDLAKLPKLALNSLSRQALNLQFSSLGLLSRWKYSAAPPGPTIFLNITQTTGLQKPYKVRPFRVVICFFWPCWLNSGPNTHQVGALPLSYILCLFFLFFLIKIYFVTFNCMYAYLSLCGHVYLSAQRSLEGGPLLIPTVSCFVMVTSLINIPKTLGERILTCSQAEKETSCGENITGFTAIVP